MAGCEEGCQCPRKWVGGDHVRVCDPTPAENPDACYEMKVKTAFDALALFDNWGETVTSTTWVGF